MQLVGKGILVAATDKINRTTKVCIFLLKKCSFRVKIVDFFRAKYPPPQMAVFQRVAGLCIIVSVSYGANEVKFTPR